MTPEHGVAKNTPETPITGPVTELTRGIPGWSLRAVLLAAGLGAVFIQGGNGLELLFLVLMGLLAVLAAVVPASPAAAMLIVAVAAFAGLSSPDPLRPAVLAAIPLLHLVHLAAALAAVVPWDARIHPRALLRPGLRFVVVQAVTFAVAGLLAVLPTSENALPVELAALLGAAALALLALRLIGRSGGGPDGG
jgi:hypothetical protein